MVSLNSKYTTFLLTLRNPQGKEVSGQVFVRDGIALANFQDPNLSKQLYDLEKKKGEKVFYDEKHKLFIQLYKGLKSNEIIDKLQREFKKSGGKMIEQ